MSGSGRSATCSLSPCSDCSRRERSIPLNQNNMGLGHVVAYLNKINDPVVTAFSIGCNGFRGSSTRPKMFDGFTQVRVGDVVRHLGMAGGFDHDEANGAGRKFFVLGQFFHHRVRGDIFG